MAEIPNNERFGVVLANEDTGEIIAKKFGVLDGELIFKNAEDETVAMAAKGQWLLVVRADADPDEAAGF